MWTDKTTYPYAAITSDNRLYVSVLPVYIDGEANPEENIYHINLFVSDQDVLGYILESGQWAFERTYSYDTDDVPEWSPDDFTTVWANYDIRYYDGFVHLAASEPVPVI